MRARKIFFRFFAKKKKKILNSSGFSSLFLFSDVYLSIFQWIQTRRLARRLLADARPARSAVALAAAIVVVMVVMVGIAFTIQHVKRCTGWYPSEKFCKARSRLYQHRFLRRRRRRRRQ